MRRIWQLTRTQQRNEREVGVGVEERGMDGEVICKKMAITRRSPFNRANAELALEYAASEVSHPSLWSWVLGRQWKRGTGEKPELEADAGESEQRGEMDLQGRTIWNLKREMAEAATLEDTPHSQRSPVQPVMSEEKPQETRAQKVWITAFKGEAGTGSHCPSYKVVKQMENGSWNLRIGLLPPRFALPITSSHCHWGSSKGRPAYASPYIIRYLPLLPTLQTLRLKVLGKAFQWHQRWSEKPRLPPYPSPSHQSGALPLPVAHQVLPSLLGLVHAVPSAWKALPFQLLLIKTLLILQGLCQMLPLLQSLPWSLQ